MKDQTTEMNSLSTELKKLVNWKSGRFFAFLPYNVEEKNIHAFEYGKITTDRGKVKFFVLKKFKTDCQLSCVFDDFQRDYKAEKEDQFFLDHGLFHGKEVYYLITQKNASLELINDCFSFSDAIWHSLCLLTKVDLSHKKDKELTLQEIKAICLNATLIVFGAYDGEGYVIWENSYLSNLEEIELND